MNRGRNIVKKAGIVLMAVGGCLLFSCAMIGPAVEPSLNVETPALVALGLIAVGLLVVLVFRREWPRRIRKVAPSKPAESHDTSRPQSVSPKAPR